MLRAAMRSRCPRCPQCGQENWRPLGLGTRWWHWGQVEEVPRSSTRTIRMPTTAALSMSAPIRWVRRQAWSRQFCFLPRSAWVMPWGSPTTRVPTRCSIAQSMTVFAASWWACRTRRRCRASARRCVCAQFAPAAAAALAPPGRFRAHVALAGFGIGEVESFFGADRPPRHQQCLVVDHDRIRMDDPQIHSTDSIRVDVRGLDGDRGGDVDDEASGVCEQRD